MINKNVMLFLKYDLQPYKYCVEPKNIFDHWNKFLNAQLKNSKSTV